jgi:hypothetical protein
MAAHLTADELAAMSDDEFFQAYTDGRVRRRPDAWTEDNWEEVRCVCVCVCTCLVLLSSRPPAEDGVYAAFYDLCPYAEAGGGKPRAQRAAEHHQ